jgi:2-polyprenyl-3-methyl-5-hydroxy-6-metoxy-1,4-benzoquinol methylase
MISMLDLIEHVKEPLEYLKKAYFFLKKDGYLILTTPNTNSVFSRFLKGSWPVYDGNEHLRLYNPDNLSSILVDMGFKICEKRILLKKTTLSFFFKIIQVWTRKSRGKFEKKENTLANKNEIPFIFYGGEFILVAQK